MQLGNAVNMEQRLRDQWVQHRDRYKIENR